MTLVGVMVTYILDIFAKMVVQMEHTLGKLTTLPSKFGMQI